MTRFLRLAAALSLAGGLALAGALPVAAAVTGPSRQLGSPPQGVCAAAVTTTAAASTGFLFWTTNQFDLTATQYFPCGPGVPAVSCTVYLSGVGAVILDKTFSGACTLSGTQKQAIGSWATSMETKFGGCQGTGLSGLGCDIKNMLHDLANGQVIQTLTTYTAGALALPFYAQNGLTGWITTNHNNAIFSVYKVMAFMGLSVAAIAGAMRIIADANDNRRNTGVVFIHTGLRLFLAMTFITGFFGLAQWAIPLFNKLASYTYGSIEANGINEVFGAHGHVTSQVIFGAAGAGIAGLLGLIVALLMMIYLFVMFVFRDVILAFGIALAPIAIGLAVWDTRNQMYMHWRNLFIGGLLMSVAGAVGVGVTFAIVGGLLANAQVGNALDFFMAIVMMIGGLFATTKLMNIVMQGSMSHRSPTSLLTGMGEGAIMGMGIQKAIGAGSKRVSKGAGAVAGAAGSAAHASGLQSVGGSVARAVTGGAGAHQATGVMAHASLSSQKAFAGMPDGTVDQALASDPQAQQVLEAATSHLGPDVSYGARLQHLSGSGQMGHKLANRLVESGTGTAQLLNGANPKQVRFNYSQDEMGSMMKMAHDHAQMGADKTVKNAANAWGVA